MDCRELEGLLGAYLDEELDPIHNAEVDRHLSGCAACAALLGRQESLKAAIATHAPYFTAPDSLRQRLAAAAPRSQPAARPAAMPARWWAVAAAFAFAAVAIWQAGPAIFHPGGLGQRGLEQEVVAAHVRSLLANHLMDVPSTDLHTVKPWFAGKLNFSPEVDDLAAQGFTLEGGRLDYLDGRTVAALIYRRRQHTINVFTWPAERTDEAPRLNVAQGYNVVRWVRARMNWWAVSDLNGAELQELARDLGAK